MSDDSKPSTINPMCERKTNDIMQRDGYKKTGYVLMTDDPADRICVSDQGAVSWFTRDQWWWLMHNRDHVEFQWPKPIGASPSPASDAELPPLPEPEYCADDLSDIFTATQMRAYGLAAQHMRWCAEVNADGLREENAELRAELAASTRTASDTRTAALEEAAKVAEETDVETYVYCMVQHDDGAATRSNIAAAIRALAAGEAECDAALGRAAPAGQHDAIAAARARLESKWDAEGDCGSCGWHAALYEHNVEDWELEHALEKNGGVLELSCISKDDDQSSSHRGVKINIAAPSEESATSRGGAQGRITQAETRMDTGSCGGAQVDVEAERKLYLHNFPAFLPGYWTERQEHDFKVWLAARTQADAGKAEQPSDPMDWPLPCDVKVGAGTITKGCKLRTLVTRMNMLHRMAMEGLPKVTPEQQAAFFAMFPHLKPADPETTTKPENP